MAVTASVLLLAVQLIHRSLSLSSRVRQHQNEMRSFAGFAETFRHDVQHSQELAAAEKSRIELAMGDGRIVYEITPEHVWRRVIRDKELYQHDTLPIPYDLEAVLLASEAPKRVTLRLQSKSPVVLPEPIAQSQATAVLGIRWRESSTGRRDSD
jgi:hypothetical protein